MTGEDAADSPLTGVRNFRDLGGLPGPGGARVRPGRLFRSGHLAEATPADQEFLAGLGLRTVFDFRNDADRALEGPDVPLPGVQHVVLPLSDAADGEEFWRTLREGTMPQLRAALAGGRAEASMLETYRAMVRDRTGEHGRMLRDLAAGGTPALLHCAAGKDRAGLAIAIVLLALGVERDAIVADYLKSNAPHRRYRLRRTAPDAPEEEAEARRLVAPLFDARTAYLDAAFDEIDVRFGGPERYLTEVLGLTDAARQRLREDLLTA